MRDSLTSVWRNYRRSRKGAAAAEFAILLPLLVIPLLNVIDLGVYVYDRMEVNNAAQVAAQAAWSTCAAQSPSLVPATAINSGTGQANCPTYAAEAATAAQNTASMGQAVTITSITENYYCLNKSNALVTVGTFPGNRPGDCSSVGSANEVPGDYVTVAASYTYTPWFSGVSVASLLKTPITMTATTRLN